MHCIESSHKLIEILGKRNVQARAFLFYFLMKSDRIQSIRKDKNVREANEKGSIF